MADEYLNSHNAPFKFNSIEFDNETTSVVRKYQLSLPTRDDYFWHNKFDDPSIKWMGFKTLDEIRIMIETSENETYQ